MAELLLGVGNNKDKRVTFPGVPKAWVDLTTVDIDPGVNPTIVHDLNVTPWPFKDNTFDEVHAYEVLEHLGRQGDIASFFSHFYEIWRILKPGGYLAGTTPMWDSPWAWGDPGHTRIINRNCFIFLDIDEYKQVGRTSMTDYRKYWKGDFKMMTVSENEDVHGFILQAVKPARVL